MRSFPTVACSDSVFLRVVNDDGDPGTFFKASKRLRRIVGWLARQELAAVVWSRGELSSKCGSVESFSVGKSRLWS